jgi:hypothetical protein
MEWLLLFVGGGDRVVVVGSYDLMRQFKNFIERNIPGSMVKVKQDGRIYLLYIYSATSKMVLKFLYSDCHIALDRKLAKTQPMFS